MRTRCVAPRPLVAGIVAVALLGLTSCGAQDKPTPPPGQVLAKEVRLLLSGDPQAVRLARGVGSATVGLSPTLRHETRAVSFLCASSTPGCGEFTLEDHGEPQGSLTVYATRGGGGLSAVAPEGLTGQTARISVPADAHWAVYLVSVR